MHRLQNTWHQSAGLNTHLTSRIQRVRGLRKAKGGPTRVTSCLMRWTPTNPDASGSKIDHTHCRHAWHRLSTKAGLTLAWQSTHEQMLTVVPATRAMFCIYAYVTNADAAHCKHPIRKRACGQIILQSIHTERQNLTLNRWRSRRLSSAAARTRRLYDTNSETAEMNRAMTRCAAISR